MPIRDKICLENIFGDPQAPVQPPNGALTVVPPGFTITVIQGTKGERSQRAFGIGGHWIFTLDELVRAVGRSWAAFFAKPFATNKNSKAWRNLIKELDALKSTQTTD